MSKKLVTGILVGAAVGAALGILFAPDKGKETRRKISKKTTDLGDTVRNKFNELGSALQDKYDSIRGEANSILDKGKDTAKDIKEDVQRNFS